MNINMKQDSKALFVLYVFKNTFAHGTNDYSSQEIYIYIHIIYNMR